jgi:tetratricopeptide (TPR) repeat protein
MSDSFQSSNAHRQLKDARSLYDQGKEEHCNVNYVSALQFFRRAVTVQESVLGKYHQDTIKTYWRMGKSACMANEDQEALQSFQRAVRMAEFSFDDRINQNLLKDLKSCWRQRHPESDQSLEKMAQVLSYERQGDAKCKQRQFQKAVDCYQRALSIQDSLFSSDSLDGADIRCKLACCFLRFSKVQNAQQDAQQLLQKSHECYLRRLGDDHPATLGAAANMKSARRSMGRKDAFKKKGWLSASMSSLGSTSKHSITCR